MLLSGGTPTAAAAAAGWLPDAVEPETKVVCVVVRVDKHKERLR